MQKVKNNYFNRKRGSLISVRLPLLSSQTRNNVLRKTRCSDLHLLVEARRVELLSENLSPKLSTSVAASFNIPSAVRRRAGSPF